MRCLWMFVTAVCFLFLLKLTWPKNKNIYQYRYLIEILPPKNFFPVAAFSSITFKARSFNPRKFCQPLKKHSAHWLFSAKNCFITICFALLCSLVTPLCFLMFRFHPGRKKADKEQVIKRLQCIIFLVTKKTLISAWKIATYAKVNILIKTDPLFRARSFGNIPE